MASKVSSGQSEIYRTRMLPVVSSAHNSLPRDSHKDAQKIRSSSEISGRKNQAHGFKPLFPLDTSNFVSKIVDRNSQDSKDTREPKPRLITPVSSSIARPSPYPKDLHKAVKKEHQTEEPPKLPPRKKLPHSPSTPKTERPLNSTVVKTERRSLPSPRAERGQSKIPTRTDRTYKHLSGTYNSSQQPATTERLQQTTRADGKLQSQTLRSDRKGDNSGSVSTQIPPETSELKDNYNSTRARESQSSSSQEDRTTDINKPLTRTNVTQHDKIWVKNEPKNQNGVLSPPLQDITPETTEELWNNFDPLDVLDSGSDSSADTMIMMTTEEEKKNEEKIQQNQKQYEKQRFTANHEKTSSHRAPQNHAYLNHSKDLDLSPKSSEEDDGYGTNSSTSTNFSSSLSSLGNGDMEQKPLHGILKKTGKYVANSSNSSAYNTTQNGQSSTTWAVRRRTKLTESQDNSLQEKLRQLAIIEEENTHEDNNEERLGIIRRNSDASNTGSVGYSSDNDSHWKSVVNSAPAREDSHMARRGRPSEEEEKQEEVIQNDLKKFEGELYDKLTDMDLNYRNYYGFDKGQNDEKEDSKVLYFQHKMIKQQYGNDNYYNPNAHQSASNSEQGDNAQAHTLPTQSHSMAKSMTSMPELCRRAYSTDSRHVPNYAVQNGYESQNTSYRSVVSNNSGHYSSQDYVNGSHDNISVHSGYSMPGSLYKTKYVSVDNINQNGKRTAFASSADIYNLFQSKENLATQLQRPASYRHSFHAVPVSVAGGKDPNSDIFNEKHEQRPRSASTSTKNKSWNPFGGLFSKKRTKASQSGENLSKQSEKSSKNSQQGSTQTPVIQHLQNQAPEMLPRRQLVEDKGPISPPIIKSSTLPRHISSDRVFPDKPFKTIALFEESGTKLSTLV